MSTECQGGETYLFEKGLQVCNFRILFWDSSVGQEVNSQTHMQRSKRRSHCSLQLLLSPETCLHWLPSTSANPRLLCGPQQEPILSVSTELLRTSPPAPVKDKHPQIPSSPAISAAFSIGALSSSMLSWLNTLSMVPQCSPPQPELHLAFQIAPPSISCLETAQSIKDTCTPYPSHSGFRASSNPPTIFSSSYL